MAAMKRVYRASNFDLRENYIGCTSDPIEGLRAVHASQKPEAIAHWDFSRHKIEYTDIGVELGAYDYANFIRQYSLTTTLLPGWKTLTEQA